MGCASSKAEEQSELIALCRERLELIRAARDRRHDLARAHLAYFRELAAVGNALHRFVREELAPASLPSGSPVLILPPGDGKGKPRSGPLAAAASVSSSATSLSHSISLEDSHLPLSSGSGSRNGEESDAGGKTENRGGVDDAKQQELPSSNLRDFSHSPSSSYMRSSTAIPTLIYEDPFAPIWTNSSHNEYGYGFDYPSYGFPIGSPSHGREAMMTGTSVPQVDPGTPPPPAPESSVWDFFDPFVSYEEFMPDYSGGKLGVRSSVSSPDLMELRKQEGIPDLEEVAEVEPMKLTNKKKGDDDSGVRTTVGNSNLFSTQAMGQKDEKAAQIGLADKEKSSANSKVKSNDGDEGSSRNKNTVTYKGSSYLTDESGPSGDKSLSARSDAQTLMFQGPRDMMEVVKEIKDHFSSATDCGEEVSTTLEVDKLPYRPRSRRHRVISRFFCPMTLRVLIHSHPFKRSKHSIVSTKQKASNSNNHVAGISSSLSSVLEKLYLWEKKLFTEVKDEEKLRFRYEKKYKRLKDLDDKGEDNSKIDLAWASVKDLHAKLSIIIKSVTNISDKMHKIRDEELGPQLIQLIQSLVRMWKSMMDCHQKQLQALVGCKNYNLVIKRKSGTTATKELEMVFLNLCKCFNNWISIQKSFVEALNGWQMKWLPQEQELTPDGLAPFSPTRIGAPSVFIVSNDWYHAMKCISADKVLERMRSFAETVHLMWVSQNEEQNQRLEEEELSKAFNTRVKSMQVKQDNGHLEIVSENNDLMDENDESLMAIKKRLDEKRELHKETLIRLEKIVSNIFPTLVPTFEELGTFTSEALKAYNGIRVTMDTQQHNIQN
ncbi:protein ALTERED PHOSPHATE STARVATION RESPONSE 1-like [Zingiber officinale]|uniref:Uncharacterized protein n=1 Tax=Zingiber officinale TaxID=94328 RepID=A0A8J5LBM9_ZINOF|nr:protein ALTERED PHOSPHATE STARVATION RESPONSE 1-like [Zingiber officinale]KAG6522267.1 hypothetical protein ZIOFF_019405 [Zingiber officinale]